MSQLKVNSIVDAAGGSSAVLYGVASPPNSMGFRNRIINGEMRIDQRNAGASVTIASTVFGYRTVDRWQVNNQTDGALTIQQSTIVPAGFNSSVAVTVTTADASLGAAQFCFLRQTIEGFNVGDLAFGSASASPITMSFWVRSSVTGTMGGSITNGAINRSYPFTYSISAANTWEYKTVSLSGDTTGTWATDNSAGMNVFFSLGCGTDNSGTAGAWTGAQRLSATGATSVVGTNGATFYITGVQLEAGSVASPFERRDYGRELMMCQRYYYRVTNNATAYTTFAIGRAYSSTEGNATVYMPVPMRASPTIGKSAFGGSNWDYSISAINIVQVASDFRLITVYSAGAFTNGGAYALAAGNTTSTIFLDFSAEL